jgi:hypothetical protein
MLQEQNKLQNQMCFQIHKNRSPQRPQISVAAVGGKLFGLERV